MARMVFHSLASLLRRGSQLQLERGPGPAHGKRGLAAAREPSIHPGLGIAEHIQRQFGCAVHGVLRSPANRVRSNGADRPDPIARPQLSTARKAHEDYFGEGANNAIAFEEQYQGLPKLNFAMADTARHFIMLDDPQWFFAQVDGFLKDPVKTTQQRGFAGST